MKKNAKKTTTDSKKKTPVPSAKAKAKGTTGKQPRAKDQSKVHSRSTPEAVPNVTLEAQVAAEVAEPVLEPQEAVAAELAHEPEAASDPAAEPAPTPHPAEDVPAAAAPKGPQTSAAARRLPPVGTVLQKRDRQGQLRCECVVIEDGVHYAGTVYRSLSAAAVAATRDLGLKGSQVNGFTFWGLTRPARQGADPLAAIERVWGRYATSLEALLERTKGTSGLEPVLAALKRHVRVLQNLNDEVA